MKLFKKSFIFYMAYTDKMYAGSMSELRQYYIFTKKSKIIIDFNDWYIKNIKEINEGKINNFTVTTNIKIINL